MFDHLPFFVYGTLQRSGCRERCWPVAATRIVPAWTRGFLFDLGPYPALVPGVDCVMGELWYFAEQELAEVIHAVDLVEGHLGRPDDLYTRQIVDCMQEGNGEVRAYAYIYARTLAATARRVTPDANGVCRWPCK